VYVDCQGTNHADEEKISKAIRETFRLTPRSIIETLQLRKPIYKPTAKHGHFGRQPSGDLFTWERTDKADALKKLV
jgi:S-adenosylmethionine synthetase